MGKRNRLVAGGILLVILLGVILLSKISPYFRTAPWAEVKPPYFEYSMGEIYKEVPLAEAERRASFKIYRPVYLPAGLPPYRVALRIKPRPLTEVAFFTPEFPGVKPGSLRGLKIREATVFETNDDFFQSGAEIIMIEGKKVWIHGTDGKYQDMFLRLGKTKILVEWSGKKASRKELLKIGKFLISSDSKSNFSEE